MTNVEWGNNTNFIFMGDQNQEGGTSTPGKRPGCSVHVLSLKNARLAKPHSLLPYHASPRTPMDYGILDYANYIQLCPITTSRSTVFISSPYHHLALSPAASCQLPATLDSSIPRLRGRLFIFSLWVRRQATAPRMQVKPVEAGNGWWLTWSLCGNHNRIYPGLKRSKYIQINPNKTIRHWNTFLNVIKWN